ncbi:hypothetical protein KFU94_46690 [Chloroflexi bacterium TSY]|nr:hypothetical protein [Chloroflexi bacterium TSY]
MDSTLYIATDDGLLIGRLEHGKLNIQHQTLTDSCVTSAIVRDSIVLAGTKDGIYRSHDNGQTWSDANRGLSQRHVRWLAYHPDLSDREFAGTEPAALFVSHDSSDLWHEAHEVATLFPGSRLCARFCLFRFARVRCR